jgi:2-iminobutanoate/2-iminopropanoate deaminase
MKKIVNTERAPQPIGPYSQAVGAAGLFITSGQVGLHPETHKVVEGGIAAQTSQVLKNLQTILEAAGTTLDRTIKVTVFLADMNDFAAMNEVYAQFFPQNPPARSTVQVAKLPLDALIEIELIALGGD